MNARSTLNQLLLFFHKITSDSKIKELLQELFGCFLMLCEKQQQMGLRDGGPFILDRHKCVSFYKSGEMILF